MGDKEKNKKFIIAILTESITGAGKFKENSDGVAKEICEWGNGRLMKYDMNTYIYRVFKEISEKDIAINHKSSGTTWATLRIYLKSHKPFDALTKKEKKDDIFKIINGVQNRDIIKKKNLKDYGIDNIEGEGVKELGKDKDNNKYTIRDKKHGSGKTCDVTKPDGGHYNITVDKAREKLNKK